MRAAVVVVSDRVWEGKVRERWMEKVSESAQKLKKYQGETEGERRR